MFGDKKDTQDTQKNIKDTSSETGLTLRDTSSPISYKKTNKLISALYMVTDIMDKDEPLRHKLRSLSIEIISDITRIPEGVSTKIYEIVSFLDVAGAVNLISEMNRNILRKEFMELHQSIEEYREAKQKRISIEDFLSQPIDEEDNNFTLKPSSFRSYSQSYIGHDGAKNKNPGTRIGVQKGSTLMKALSGVGEVSDSFDNLKKQRRDDIKIIIKDKPEGMTIKDIKNSIKDRGFASLLSTSEKTLQRELMSMVKDGVLNKTGEKRWSKYFVSNS